MSKTRWMFGRVCGMTCVALGLLAMNTPTAWAALVNKYTFNNGNANDSVGGQHGTLVDNTNLALFSGGMIDLSGNSATTGSNQDFCTADDGGSVCRSAQWRLHERGDGRHVRRRDAGDLVQGFAEPHVGRSLFLWSEPRW